MAKIALISDIHWGCRNDNPVVMNHTRNFFHEQFFPTLKSRGIEDIFMLGDIYDRRKYINIATAHFVREHFVEPLKQYYRVIVIPGNHDAYHSNSLTVNSLTEIFQSREGKKFTILTDPQVVPFTWGKALFLPWICKDNEEVSMKLINETDAKICFGHLELKGFESNGGTILDSGLDSSIFSRFALVVSGHIHKRQTNGNILYLGSPLQTSWADFDITKGFYIFDTVTWELEFIKNPRDIFHKIVYNDEGRSLEQVMAWDFDVLKDCYIKIVVQTKTNPYHFDMFVSELEKVAIDVKVVEDADIQHSTEAIDATNMSNTIDILRKFINETEIQGDKSQLDNLMTELYTSALMVE